MNETILSSWNDSGIRKSLTEFVNSVCDNDSSSFVPPSDRIAVFDNDGTLWCERPLMVQLYYILDKIEELMSEDTSLALQQPYKALAEKDLKTLMAFDKKELFEAVFRATGEGTVQAAEQKARQWFDTAKHPELNVPFYDVAYKPQLELLEYLRSNGFTVFIVSGGGTEFMRVVSERIYGIPTHQVIGSTLRSKVDMQGVKPVIMHVDGLRNFDDKDEKILNIHYHIGKRPLLAFGNSDGDLAMMRYTLAGEGIRMALLLHHDDADREFAYDRDFKLSRLSEALDVAAAEGINVVSMKNDWKEIF